MESQQDNISGIDKLKKGLYSRERDSHAPTAWRRHRLKGQSYNMNGDWTQEKDELKNKPVFFEPQKLKERMSFASKILIASIVFFAASSLFAFYKFYWESNTISANNIEIFVTAPISVSGGEKIGLDVKILNNNKISLKSADLRVEYPEGARAPDDLKTELKRSRDALGDIPDGAVVSKRVEAVLFGEANSKKEIKVTVEYRIPGSSAIFYKEKIYEVVISDSPINIEVSGLKEINANQTIDFIVAVTSNSSNQIRNLLLKAEYPFGFVFVESNEKPLDSNNNLWSLGDLLPGQKKIIKIRGKIQGQDGEDKIVRFTTGIAGENDEKIISTSLVTSLASVSIKRPFIGIELEIDGKTGGNFVSQSGKIIRASVIWKNNLATAINDVEIRIKLQGNILNKSSVSVEHGFYRSIDNTIVINKTTEPSMASIGPGQGGSLNFSFGSLSSYDGNSQPIREGVISIDVAASGKKLEGNNVPQEALYSTTKIVKIDTDLQLTSRIIYWSGPFQNTGPIPPKAEQETTYTIIWTVKNSSNKVKNAQVKATLPIYVKWLSKIIPEEENVSFNPSDGEIVWDIGNIEAGTGFGGRPKELAFQVSFLPSVSQIGQNPIILSESAVIGVDDFTSTAVGETRPSLNTTLKTDPDFKYTDDKVVK